jgi:5-formyltetrahydrofolate cyclo-ligase
MKEAIRKQMLETRNNLTEAEVDRCSNDIFANLKQNSFFMNSKHIMIYLSFKQEVKTDPIISYCLNEGKKVYIPICIPETHELCISRITALEELKSGHFGIREPMPEYIRLSDSSLIDVVLIPGIAFDRNGNRVGFGAGYYDRFLKRLSPEATKAALAFSFQVVDVVPSDEYDIPVDYIVTEQATIKCAHNNI